MLWLRIHAKSSSVIQIVRTVVFFVNYQWSFREDRKIWLSVCLCYHDFFQPLKRGFQNKMLINYRVDSNARMDNFLSDLCKSKQNQKALASLVFRRCATWFLDKNSNFHQRVPPSILSTFLVSFRFSETRVQFRGKIFLKKSMFPGTKKRFPSLEGTLLGIVWHCITIEMIHQVIP